MKKEKLLGLVDSLISELEKSTEIFLEERPILWKQAGITKAKENLEEEKKQNQETIKNICNEIDKKSVTFEEVQQIFKL